MKMISKYFSEDELKCTHTGRCEMNPMFMELLDRLRERVGPMKVNSGFRDPSHPEEVGKAGGPGSHTLGLAVDIKTAGKPAYDLVREAISLGFTGIGLQQNSKLEPSRRFIHLDKARSRIIAPRPTIWSY